jgi:hypothetical protein
MTIYELRLVMIVGLLALGALAILAALAVTRLKELASHADTRMAGARTAAWRQRC